MVLDCHRKKIAIMLSIIILLGFTGGWLFAQTDIPFELYCELSYKVNPSTENLFELCDFLNDIDSEKYPQYCHELVDREDFLDNISCSEFYYDGINDNISDNTKIKLYVRSMYLITCVYNYAEHNDVDGFVKEVSYINSKYYYYYNNRIIPDIYKMLEACDNNFALENKTAVIDALCDIIIEQSNNSKDSVNNSQFVKDELYFVLAYYRNNDCQGLKHPKFEMEEIYSDVIKDYSETYTDEYKQALLERDNQIISEYKSYWENLLKTSQV